MDNDYFAYTYINILKIPMVTVSVINGVSMSIIDEKRLGKPPLPSGGPHHPTTLKHPKGLWAVWGGWAGVVCTAMVGRMYTGRYLAVSGVSTVHTS